MLLILHDCQGMSTFGFASVLPVESERFKNRLPRNSSVPSQGACLKLLHFIPRCPQDPSPTDRQVEDVPLGCAKEQVESQQVHTESSEYSSFHLNHNSCQQY